MESALMVFAIVTALGVFLGGLALFVWVAQKGEAAKKRLDNERATQRRQMEHAERLKTLEAGLPLPDAELAWAAAERSRALGAAAVGIAVPIGLALAAVGVTAIILALADSSVRLPLLCVVWGVCGLTSLMSVIGSLANLGKPHDPAKRFRPSPVEPPRLSEPSTAVSEHILNT